MKFQFSSIQFSHSVMSDSLWPHELQHTRPPCPSPTPGVYPNSCPLSQWCHPTISSFVIPFSSCPQSFPAWRSFQMGQLFTSGGQTTGVSASATVLPMNIQGWFPLGLTGFPCSPKDSQESSPSPQFEQLSSAYWAVTLCWALGRAALHTYLILFKPYNSICEVGVATLHLQTKDQRFREFNMHKGAKDKVGFESNSRPRAPTGRYLWPTKVGGGPGLGRA